VQVGSLIAIFQSAEVAAAGLASTGVGAAGIIAVSGLPGASSLETHL